MSDKLVSKVGGSSQNSNIYLTNLLLKAYAEAIPSDSFGIYVKGVA